ncbi:CLUMA_CG011903, isoform B [Clunio marinus]|uniref:CLUMA_CG011903, isoform B n=1 Tax=Clunio marinus TaxID=568069 RepID=A0A1J1IJD2_9DIPT|nr:CLUMA_CG011903, isoform B [Clunio marinus]
MTISDSFKRTFNKASERKMSCEVILRIFKFIPVLFISCVIIWSWYAYVIELCIKVVDTKVEAFFLLLFYHVCFVFLVWSYYKTIFTKVAVVPAPFKVSRQELDQLFKIKNPDEQTRLLKHLAADLPILNCTINNCVRFCEKCQHIKPDRAHHCSVCNVCNLKMDHHCPWVNNCINFSNYKFFILFLGYGLLYCIYVALSMVKYFVLFWKGELGTSAGKFHLLFLFVVALMFAFSLLSLFGYHLYLVANNRTTLEAFRAPIFSIGGPDKNGFSLGYKKNFEQVFGDNKYYWLLPVFTSLGDGIKYPVRKGHLLDELCNHKKVLKGNRKKRDKGMTETEPKILHTNGNGSSEKEDIEQIPRPADIEQDMREMERRKRVEAIMCSRMFREELERIVDGQLREGPSQVLQQISDMMGVPTTKVRSYFRDGNCVIPINDIRGIDSMGYEKGEKILRCKLAATFRLLNSFGFSSNSINNIVTARLNADQELFLVNPYGLLFHEITASSLNKVDMQGAITDQGTTNFGINISQFIIHSVIHAARPDIRCIIGVSHSAVVAVSSLKTGLIPLTKDAAVLGEIATHNFSGALNEPEEREKLTRSLGPNAKVLLLTNHGALCCGETIEEAFYNAQHTVKAAETLLALLPVGLDNLIPIPEETHKAIYDASRKPPEGTVIPSALPVDNKENITNRSPKWRVGGAEFEALMRMLDNAGFRTGYIYRNPLVKHEVPKPRSDVEVPPAVSSLGYLLEEEEMYKQGLWKKGDFRKGGDRQRWLNSPNVYQKVEVLETGTTDPKKITKWVVDGSPTHSTPVKIDGALQFVPLNTTSKEFKKLQQQIKDYRRAEKISAGPQSHILEGVTWDEANRLKDANVSKTGDHVVLMGAASKGIIQRGYQHNASVYKTPYAKNPFDSVTDDELKEYKRSVENKRGGDYTDTDFSESELLSSMQISSKIKSQSMSPPNNSEGMVMRIETTRIVPSQPEVVLSDESNETDILKQFMMNEQNASYRGENVQNGDHSETQNLSTFSQSSKDQDASTDGSPKKDKKKKKGLRTPSFLKKKKDKKKVEN